MLMVNKFYVELSTNKVWLCKAELPGNLRLMQDVDYNTKTVHKWGGGWRDATKDEVKQSGHSPIRKEKEDWKGVIDANNNMPLNHPIKFDSPWFPKFEIALEDPISEARLTISKAKKAGEVCDDGQTKREVGGGETTHIRFNARAMMEKFGFPKDILKLLEVNGDGYSGGLNSRVWYDYFLQKGTIKKR